MHDKHARPTRKTLTDQAALQGDPDPEKVPASAPPSLSGMFKHARFLARFLAHLAVDQFVEELINSALQYTIGSEMPEGIPDWEKSAIGAGFSYALDELRYGAPRRWRRHPKPQRLPGTWEELLDRGCPAGGDRLIRPYDRAASYGLGDAIEHDDFGVGVVVEFPAPARVLVRFGDRDRLLACGRAAQPR